MELTHSVVMWFRAKAVTLPIVTFVAWAIFYLPRTWLFGFYEDDWDQLIYQGQMPLLDQIATWWQLASIRPIAVLLTPVFSHTLGARPMVWQGILAFAALGSALLFYKVLHRIGSRSFAPRDVTADAVVAGWLLMPWSVASSAWPALLSQAVISQLLFFSSFYIAAGKNITVRRALVATVLYLASHLAYEAFYGGLLVIIYFCVIRHWISRGTPSPNKWATVYLVGGLIAAQCVALIYNRFLTLFQFAGSKPWNAGWLDLTVEVARNVPQRLCHNGEACQVWPEAVRLAGQGLVVTAVVVTLGLVAISATRRRALAWAGALVVITLLSVATIAMYATGGYGIVGASWIARSTLSLCVWLALGVFAVLELIRTALPFRVGNVLVPALVAPALVYLGVNLSLVQVEWHRARDLLTEVLDSAPVEQIASLPPTAPLIYVGPTKVQFLEIIGRWTLTDGLYERWPSLRVDASSPEAVGLDQLPGSTTLARRVFAKGAGIEYAWDGATLQYGMPGFWTESKPATSVYVWYYADQRVVPLPPGGTVR